MWGCHYKPKFVRKMTIWCGDVNINPILVWKMTIWCGDVPINQNFVRKINSAVEAQVLLEARATTRLRGRFLLVRGTALYVKKGYIYHCMYVYMCIYMYMYAPHLNKLYVYI